jgi:anaerobic selenocysteine-containing dehydrogenase
MKIDRRSFLSFAIGGAAGTALSPLPWKLLDDVSIWTQNWPWTPVPQDGEAYHVNSTCTLCPGGCGITVGKIDERVVKIEGMPNHPVNNGGICTLGLTGAQLLYRPSRIKNPLKKVNGSWRNISWDDAVAEIAAKLKDLRSKGLSHTLACISDSDRGTVAELFSRFLTAYGSPNYIRTPSIQDTYELTLHLTHGVRAMAGFDIANADLVLSFGSALIEGWGSPVFMFQSKSTLTEKGGRMEQIETRLSKTAAKADKWVALNPGTEGVLAFGLAHVLVKEKLYNRQFVDNETNGLSQLGKGILDAYTPDKVSEITGIDAEQIIAVARKFARAKRPLAICGRGRGNTPGGIQEFLAVHTLNALAGNINKSGGIWAVPEPDYISWPELQIDGVAARGLQQNRVDGAGSENYPLARYLLNRLPAAIDSGQDSPVQVLFVANANPIYSMPDTQAVRNAFDKIPLVVSFSSFMDETAADADLILPNHVYLERWEDIPAASGFPRPIIGLARPVVDPHFNTRHTGDVIIQLAKAMGGTLGSAFYWEDYQSCLEETMGEKWDALLEEGYWLEDIEPEGSFETESAKFEFSNKEIAEMPRYFPLKAEGDETHYPLILIPYDSMRLTSTYIGSPPFMIKSLEDFILKGNDVLVELNPATAKKYGLQEGKYATLSTPKGRARVKVHLSEKIMPGVLAMIRGLGHTAYDKFLADKGINYNSLAASAEDAASGFDASWGIRARLNKS